MKISVKHDIKQMTKRINGFADQIPFATSRALNNTAFEARGGTIERLKTDIDRPTPYTLKGVKYGKSNKRNLTASVFILPERWRYLFYQVHGGTRTPQNRAIAVPAAVRLNEYGNMPKGSIARLLARPDTFQATIGGRSGIWQRNKRGKLKLLFHYQPKVTYRGGRFKYELAVNEVVRKRFTYHFAKSVKQAIKTARL